MKTLTQTVPGTLCNFETIRKSMMILAWTVSMAIFLLPNAFAQSITKLNVMDLGFAIQIPDVILNQGQSVEAILVIGNDQVVKDALGFDVWLEMGSNASITTSLEPTMSGSWMGDPAVSVVENVKDGVYSFSFLRTMPIAGQGQILKIRLTAEKNGVSARSLIARSGGLMIVDNLELRLAGSNDLKVWPNPLAVTDGATTLQVAHLSSTVMSTKIQRMDGSIAASFGPLQILDVKALPVGTYWLSATVQTGEVYYSRLVLK